jgi:predicted ATPase
VIQYLKEQHPDQLSRILDTLRHRVPQLERADAETLADGRLLLTIKDAPFDRPVLAKFASDGTLKMLAYLTVLYDPNPPQLIGIEEPENHIHPLVLPELAEECVQASARTQIIVTTHSPEMIMELSPDMLWVLDRDARGYTQAVRADGIPGVPEMLDEGAKLGELWAEGYLRFGPIQRAGQDEVR